jgi:hypothetical protein
MVVIVLGQEPKKHRKKLVSHSIFFEKKQRDQSRLGRGDDSGLDLANVVENNMSWVMKADDDVDAEKILTAIAPRPVWNSIGFL